MNSVRSNNVSFKIRIKNNWNYIKLIPNFLGAKRRILLPCNARNLNQNTTYVFPVSWTLKIVLMRFQSNCIGRVMITPSPPLHLGNSDNFAYFCGNPVENQNSNNNATLFSYFKEAWNLPQPGQESCFNLF